jgi:sugar phosphate isomerase/epimerase
MKLMTNITTSIHDLPRYRDNQDLKRFYRDLGLDGLEVMEGGSDEKGIIAADDVIGVHLKYFNDWIGFWRGDTGAVLEEYGSEEIAAHIFGGLTREAMLDTCRKNLAFAETYSPEYAVFHVSNVSLRQSITREKKYRDEEVVDTVIELINRLFQDQDKNFLLLFENLWWSGLSMTRPEIVRRLLKGVRYKNKGIMLDIGHLLNTNTSLRSLDEGIDYIHRTLDLYDDLGFIKGVHLHQSLSGEYVEHTMRHPVTVEGAYYEKAIALHSHIVKIDNHKPFLSEKIGAVLKRTNPEYLVLEFISSHRDEHAGYIKEQMAYLRSGQ